MDFSQCSLYKLSRKRDLNSIVKIKVHIINKYNLQYKPYIEKKQKKRLIEAPKNELKMVQKKIKRELDYLIFPDNVFSGIKGRSYIDNAYYHINSNDFKKITGCVIKNHELVIPNKTKYKIAKLLKQDNYTQKEINSILGLINNAHLFDRNKYNDLQYKIKNKCLKNQKVC